MNISPLRPNLVQLGFKPSRRVLAALLLTALAVAVIAGSALAAPLLLNGSFETDSDGDGIPNDWFDFSAGSLPKRVCNQSYAGSCSVRMLFDGSVKQLTQLIDVNGVAGDEFTLKAWTKGKAVVLPGSTAHLNVNFNLTGGGTDQHLYALPAGTYPWTLRSFSATASADFDSIQINLFISDADSGKMWFDKVKLVEVP